ncbi:hypothetical protein H0H92_015816 [Tricholoma furcatifolium]|nr:hypothetical protein H0H92_015816 [Tricholoma furcatifolium]
MHWQHTVDIDIILSEFSSRSLLLADISVLAATLACSSPALHTFATLLPFKWIDALRTIASSPSLQKIVLTDDSIIQTQLFPPASILNPGLHFRALRDIMLAYAAIPSLAPVMRAIADATDPAAPLEGREDAADAARAMVRGVSALDRARWRRCNPFLVEARRHTRLVELIAAGTPWYVPDMELTQAVPRSSALDVQHLKLDSVDMKDTISSLSLSDIILDPAILPTKPTIFFDNWPRANPLPTPAQIRASTFDSTFKVLCDRVGAHGQRILHFPDLSLVIKHGRRTTIAEGQTLWALAKFCPTVRAPTVYGWCQDGNETFIYLSYIDGVSLDSRLDALSDTELKAIVLQVAPMITSIRRLRQPPQTTLIGSPAGGPVLDQIWWGPFSVLLPNGPVCSVKEFNDALFATADGLPMFPDHEFFRNFRASFSDTSSIRFTHTDLSPMNIIVSPTTTEVMGIIDWQESGWYPEYWEYVKAKQNSPEGWFYDGLDIVLQPYTREWEAFHQYNGMGLFM